MRISLIAAASSNNVIGVAGQLPWHLPNDFKYFKETTLGKPVLMGRLTWASIGKPLPGRHNIVMTRQTSFDAPGATIVNSPAAAIEAAGDAEELMVIGGGQIYAQFIDRSDRIYLTLVDTHLEGDAVFPTLHPDQWSLTRCRPNSADERHAFDYEFRVYDRS